MRHALALLLLAGCPKSSAPTPAASGEPLAASLGAPEVSGELAVENPLRSLASLVSTAPACAAEHDGVPGTVGLAITVRADGSVADVAVRSLAPSANADTGQCIAEAAAARLGFAVSGEGEAVVAVPVVLEAR